MRAKNGMTFWRGAVVAGSLLCVAPFGMAQVPAGRDLAEIPLEELALVPVDQVSGASKYEQSIKRAPASVTVLSSEEFANHQWSTLGAALQATPGFHVRSDRFYDYLGNRGFTRAADYNSRTLLLLDGHRLNDPIYQSASIGTEFLLDLDLVKRVEIIRGPGSSVYGSSAFYGAINVIPKQPSDFVGGQISSTVDSDGGYKVRATVGNRTNGGLEYLVSWSHLEAEGERDVPLPKQWQDETGIPVGLARQLDGTESNQAFALFRYRGLEWQSAFGRRVKDVLPLVYNSDPRRDSWGLDERAYSMFRYTSEPSVDRTLVFKAAYDHYRYDGRFSPLLANFAMVAPYALSSSLGGEVRLRQNFGRDHTLLAGVEYQAHLSQRLGRWNVDTGSRDLQIDTHSQQFSPFAQIDWTLRSNLHASTGARWDRYSIGEDRATPRVAVMWDATPTTHAKVIFGESFRAPNIDERFSQELGFVRNPNLRAETNRSLELALSQEVAGGWSFDVNGFRTRSHDLILLVPVAPTASRTEPVFMYDNKQVISTDGVEVAATGFLKSNIQVRASATFQRAIDRAMPGQQIYDAPRRVYKVSVSAPLFTPKVRATVEAFYTSERLDNAGHPAPGYLVTNASLRMPKFYRRWDLSLSVYNLAEESWTDPKNTGQIPNRSRWGALKATMDF